MKTTALANAIAMIIASASSAFASGGREDNSGLFVYLFLGFCALIILMQVVPALLMLLGFAKGVRRETPAQEAVKR